MIDNGLVVGVSIYIRKGEQTLWENGIYQNCLFLVMLFLRSPSVKSCYLVAGGAGVEDVSPGFLDCSPVPIIDMAAAMSKLDVMVEMSAQLDRQWVCDFRSRGGKTVSMRCGNDYVIDVERMVFNKPHAHLVNGAPYDAVWTLEEYQKTCRFYYQDTFRSQVLTVPHLWSPFILESVSSKLKEPRFSYQTGKKRWRIGVFEPNVCMVKTSFIPMLVCECAHRLDRKIIEHVWAFCTSQFKEQASFRNFVELLDLKSHGIVSFESRYPFVEIVSMNVDAIVCHQWENAQNYVYYETLYGGYPLIHNSDMIGNCGYRYEGFDCEMGGETLLNAFHSHDENINSYRAEAKKFLAKLSPESVNNVRFYTEALSALF